MDAAQLGIAAVEAENRADVDALVALCSEDLKWHLPAQTRTLSQLREAATNLFASYPDRVTTVHDVFSDGNKAVVRFTAIAHSADDGAEMKQVGMEIFRKEAGKIAEIWSVIARV